MYITGCNSYSMYNDTTLENYFINESEEKVNISY